MKGGEGDAEQHFVYRMSVNGFISTQRQRKKPLFW